MYLYLDLILLLNFLIDLLLLWMTAFFRKIEVKKTRLVLAAILGSLFVVLLFIPALQGSYTFINKIFFSMIIVWTAFGYGHFQKYMATFLMFYFVSFVAGGGMLAAHYLLHNNYQMKQGILMTYSAGLGDKVSWWFVIVGFPVMYWFSKSRWKQIEVSKGRLNQHVSVLIYINGKTIFCTGLIDTGNQLYEPLTQTPVMIVEASLFQPVLPEALFNALGPHQEKMIWEIERLEEMLSGEKEWLANLRLVPYRGIHQQTKLMLTIKPEQIEIRDKQQTYLTKKVLIGFNQHALSASGDYQAIVHPTLLETKNIWDNPENGRDVYHVHEA